MREIRTEIDIDAPADVVWRVLTDFPAYDSWNPFIREAVGVVAAGERLTVRMDAGGREWTLRPRVLVADAPRELRWRGRLGMPGVFDGEPIFEIEPRAGGVRFVHREAFRGVLVPVLLAVLRDETLRGFEAMNDALRTRAESRRQ
jgi:hypothetical protein